MMAAEHSAEKDTPRRSCLSTLSIPPTREVWFVCAREEANHRGDHDWVLVGLDEPDPRVTPPGAAITEQAREGA